MNRTILTTMIGVAIVFALSLSMSAQQPTTPQNQGKQQPAGSMPMGNMMEECKKHCQSTTNSVDQLNKMMEEARQSNDPAKMRAALENARKPLSEMKTHMSMCMSMMNMMNMMRDMPGGAAGNQKDGLPEKKK